MERDTLHRAWSSDAYLDGELKRQHPSLCSACQNSSLCSGNDEFAGDEGALKCLFSGYGQVAFTSSKVVEKFLLNNNNDNYRVDRRILANYAYLCLDGKSRSLDSEPCEWAHKPTNVFVTAPNRVGSEEKEWFVSYLRQLFFRFVPYKPSWWRMKSLFSDPQRVTQILPVPQHLQQWDKYLGNYISSIEKPLPGCEQNSVVFCASNQLEELKCLDLQKAAFSQRIRPEIDCKRASSGGGKLECLEMVARRQADLVTADLSHLHELPQMVLQQLEPVAVSQQAYSDYSVAVVRADSGIKFLYQLSGRKSCHASFGDTASWLAPLAVLTERSLLGDQSGSGGGGGGGNSCNKADQMAEYFGGSCVPGAADLRINQYRSGSEKLCAICKGDSLGPGHHQCERSHSERYQGQAGALRCLVEGAGEVTFMSLAHLAANVDGRSQELWAKSMPLAMDSRNFRLVCRAGPSMLLNDYERCHLARLPGKLIVGNKFASREDKLTSRRLLTWIVEKFSQSQPTLAAAPAVGQDGHAGGGDVMFDLFGVYHNQSDLLFDETTTKLVPLQLNDGMSTFDAVERQYFDPSFRQLQLSHKSSSCKVVLTSGASAGVLRRDSGSILQIGALMISSTACALMLILAFLHR